MSRPRPARVRSPITWLVLGFVIERPSYGYEIMARMERRLPGGTYPPGGTHVYNALNVLERAGHVESFRPSDEERAVPVTDSSQLDSSDPRQHRERQPKPHYRATETGIAAFREWLAEEMRSEPLQWEVLRRLAMAAGIYDVARMSELVDRLEARCVQEAQRLPAGNGVRSPARSADELMERLIVAGQRTQIDAWLGWITYARREIEEYARAGDPSE